MAAAEEAGGNPKIRRLILCALAFLWPGVAAAGEIPIIDAHSQVDHEFDLADIVPLMDRAGIRRVILAARSRRKDVDIAALARRHPDRITASVRTKSGAFEKNRPKYYKKLKKQLAMPEFQAMAELILWHAQKGHKAPQRVVAISSPQVQAALRATLKRKWPFVAHIEFAAALGNDAEKFMADFEALAAAHPNHPFALIHMAQLDEEEARRLIEAHPNVYFLTSHANTLLANRSSQPWTNLFDGKTLKPEWRKLMVEHPDRFVLAFDNVWGEDWGERYVEQAAFWRRALKTLSPEVAHAIAHKNAERLWRLPAAK